MDLYLRSLTEQADGCRCFLAVNLHAVHENAVRIKQASGKKLICVTKANAYGHGAVAVSRALSDVADMFAVATADEAAELAKVVSPSDILVLSPVSEKESAELIRRGVNLSACDKVCFDAITRVSQRLGIRAKIHIAVDTGMHRYGTDWRDVGTLLQMCNENGVCIKGIFTHCSCADSGDYSFTLTQNQRFEHTVGVLGARQFEYIHSANSAAALRGNYGNAVRAGISLYGIAPDGVQAKLLPSTAFYARITQISLCPAGESIGYGATYTAQRDIRIAVVAAGYADGVPYSLKNIGQVFVNGKKCDIVGSICMDCFCIDVTSADDVNEGDYVCLFDDVRTLCEVSSKANTILYDLLTGIGNRVKRIYL